MTERSPALLPVRSSVAWFRRVCGRPPGVPAVSIAVSVWLLVSAAPGALGQTADDAPASASGEIPLTLPGAVAVALRDNLSLQSVYLDRIVQRLALEVAEEEFTPRLDIGADAEFLRGQDGPQSNAAGASSAVSVNLPTGGSLAFVWDAASFEAPDADRAFSSGTGLVLTQPLLRGAGTGIAWAPVQRARIGERINVLSLKDTVIGTVTAVISAYRNYQQAIRQVAIARRGLEELRNQLEVNRLLIESGRLAPLENVQTEQRIASQELNIIRAEGDAEEARIALSEILDLGVETRIAPTEPLEPRQVDVELDRAYDVAFDSRADWQTSLLRLRLVDISLMIARNSRLPQLDVELGVGRRSAAESDLGSALSGTVDGRPEWSARVSFSVPTIGTQELELAETAARVDRRKAEISKRQLEAQIRGEVRNAVREVELSWRRLELARRARELAERQLAIEKEKLQAGRTSNFQILSFDQTLVDAENAELDAIISYENALTNLDQVLGTTLETWQISLQP